MLRVFENRVMRGIFLPNLDELAEEWRKLHEEVLNDLQSSPNIAPNTAQVIKSRRMRQEGHVAGTGERKAVYRVLVGKFEAKRPLGRPRHRWEDNIKIYLQEVGAWTGSSWLWIGTVGGHL
jgi:hypothetical protein